MTTDPIRLLDDPSATMELREFMLGQDRPDTLPAAERRAVERRIAASVLAFPLSMKVGGLLSQGTTTAGGGTAASTAATSSAVASSTTGGVAAGSSAAGSGAVTSGAWATGSAGIASGSVAPAAAAGGALAKATLTVVGAKGTVGALLGALTVTKGAAVLGVALATGVGASYVAKDVTFAHQGAASAPAQVAAAYAAPHRTSAPAADSALTAAPTSSAGDTLAGSEELASRRPVEARSALSLEDLEDAELASAATLDDGGVGHPRAKDTGTMAGENAQHEYASERLREEVELLRRVQQLLRSDRALAAEALERYDAKFPRGAMRAEYDVLRRRLLAMP
jgi:hypothetical protein